MQVRLLRARFRLVLSLLGIQQKSLVTQRAWLKSTMARKSSLCVIQLADDPCVRMRKVVSSFTANGIDVVYIGCRRGRSGKRGSGFRRVHVSPPIPSGSTAKIFLAPIWAIAVACYLRFMKPASASYAADFEAGLAAFLSGQPYVYDVLDTYADRYNVPSVVKAALRWMEGVVAKKARALVHVDDIRRSTLPEHKKTIVVRNVPMRKDLPAATDCKVFDLIASGNLDENRGVDQLLTAAIGTNAKIALIGRLSDAVAEQCKSSPGARHFGYVDSSEALSLTLKSKAVYAVYDPARSINLIACPNKFYDAVACGVPIVMNREISLSRVVEEHGLGWTFEFGNTVELSSILAVIRTADARYEAACRNAEAYGKSVASWDEQFVPVLRTVEGLFG